MSNDNCEMWCTTCGGRFTKEETVNISACPKCHTKGIPCDPEQDYMVEINWHELRILANWATVYASNLDKPSQDVVAGIVGRLQRQFPDEIPLTLAGEIRELRSHPQVGAIETNVPHERFAVVNGPGAVGHSKKRGEK